MLQIVYTNKMKRDVKQMQKRGKDLSKLTVVLNLLASGESMPAKYRDHQLKGEMQEYRECHIEPDWLLVYRIFEDMLVLSASGTGTHSDLFDN
ncbi:MAG: type II toxin-antitoxin system YafQ family toxin [Planctomycetaceae bacterium]|jgi:mRNA interferase YafQ|nr:type II toxin-antitoxin system YafQ family toxin [Planctomycetaceae bacterium]